MRTLTKAMCVTIRRGIEPRSSRDRAKAGRCPALFVMGSKSDRALFERCSAVGFGAMEDGMDEECSGRFFVEADAVVTDAEAEFS